MSVFLDTNVLLYSEDGDEPTKRDIARQRLREAFAEASGVISTQVLQEFYVNAIRKLGMTKTLARARVLDFASLTVVPITRDLALSATDLHQLQPLSFWDALIIRAAASAGCSTLYSEDLQDGALYDGVRVVNPFRGIA